MLWEFSSIQVIHRITLTEFRSRGKKSLEFSPWGWALMNFSKFRSVSIILLALLVLVSVPTFAQQTLGSVDGTVTDQSGAVVQGATVKIHNTATNLEVTAVTKEDGSFNIADLPIGAYEVTFSKQGFKTELHSAIIVQGNRTTTVAGKLQTGEVSSTVTVNSTPLLNETDTTTGYVLGSLAIDNTPLGTGSFTQLAILSPGVSADLLNTTGTNAGLGNQSIWANGQRDTSNSISMNAVSANNIFNGKTSSQLTGNRVVLNTGESFNSTTGEIVTSTSVYGAIGQALPTPPPETIQELHVNSAMYDASQGANSGAQIELITKSGTNGYHGGAYEYHQTTGWNADPWFNKQAGLPTPGLQRNVFGGLLGGPITKDKLFFFTSYQGQRVTDQSQAISIVAVPVGLTDDRSNAGLIAAANSFLSPTGPCGQDGNPACFTGTIDPTASKILNAKVPNGSYFIPSANNTTSTTGEANVIGPDAHFVADQVNGNIDYIFSSKDRLAAKYYYQRDPNTTPFANSELLGFPQTMQAGSQLFSLDNTTILTPNLTWEQRFGFIRMGAYASTAQGFTPSDLGMTLPEDARFPSINIRVADNYNAFNSLSIGPTSNFANAGIFQNSFQWSQTLNWVHGRHSISTGIDWNDTQLNVINKNNEVDRVTFEDFLGFLQGQVCGPNTTFCSGQDASEALDGASNRYYRAHQLGTFVQDDIRIMPNLMVDIGLRWDWDGPLSEKNGMLTNFYPSDYSYDVATDSFGTLANGEPAIGLVIPASNKAFGFKGVSNSTLTGRQWGFAPRIGLVYSPSFLKNFVISGGYGLYYDRGEFFTEFSPPAGGGISGPFGVTVAEPFVVPFFAVTGGSFAQPFGSAPLPPPPANLSAVTGLVPNASQLVGNTTTFCGQTGQSGCGPLFFGGYDPKNTIPYSENWTLQLQWQPINSWLFSLAYVGNHGLHELMPVPFNQAQIATPQNPVLAGGPFQQNYSYGYNVTSTENISTIVDGFGTGNAALRAPYIGYDPNSDFNESIGISHYNALQVGLNKQFSHGLLITASYTWSHTLDEQSGLGLFYNGNNPNDPASGYGNSDFDRRNVFTLSYLYQFPTLPHATGFKNQALNGWGIDGVTVLQSGQPYSVIDFSGGAASIYWGGGQDAITNPIVPVGGVGSTTTNPFLQGTTGINANKPVLNSAAFGIPTPIAPGTGGVPPCDSDGTCDNYETGYVTGERNIFRGPFQNRFDFSVFKAFKLNERFALKYDAQFFNIFNHPSFDTPNNNVEFNPFFNNPPIYGFSGFPACVPATGAYTCPPGGHLGLIQHTVGSPRFIQMALHLTF